MTATLEASYQPLQPFGVDMGEGDETPQESGVMIHVVPESGRARWNHVEDLDAFFTRMYHYHQKHGFSCMMVQETLELGQFLFVAGFSTFLFYCVDYPVLFKDKIPVHAQNSTKISLSDAIVSGGVCVSRFTPITWICLFVSVVFWLLRVIKVFYHLLQFLDIKAFFNSALKINDSELDNLTWHEVQSRVREVQREQQMCIHKQDLTELDIYHRILRFKNYMVAMVNKSVLPVCIRLPFIGEVVFLSRGLKYNIELLLFWGPWAPFENSWHLKEEYKKFGRRQDLAQQLEKHILWVGIANLLLCPLILLWQILYSFFNYAEVIKREPGSLGSRRWSLYGRLYLRHLNELEHELNARLNRAYRPASKYMGSFASPLMTVFAKNIAFIAGACLAVLLILTVYDEDVLTVEHLFSIMTILGGVVAGSRAFIPDENMVWCPEKLMTAVLAHAHYFPDHWRGQAHTNRVRQEFSQLFQYKAVYLLEELLSPIITPFVLCFLFRPKALEIVDFYRNFTVEVVGVGDVCSFAQMDVRRHGSPTWQGVGGGGDDEGEVAPEAPTHYAQAEDGKTELSLVHFTLTNPNWSPPTLGARNFVSALRDRVIHETGQLRQQCPETTAQANILTTSLSSMSSIGIGLNSLVTSALRHNLAHPEVSLGPPSIQPLFGTLPQTSQPVAQQATTTLNTSMLSSAAHRGGLNRAEGPLNPDRGLLYSIHQGLLGSSMGASVFGPLTFGSSGTIDDVLRLQPPIASTTAPGDPSEITAADMSLSTLYLHEVHHRLVQKRGFQESSYTDWRVQHHGGSESSHRAERTPLLDPSLRPPP